MSLARATRTPQGAVPHHAPTQARASTMRFAMGGVQQPHEAAPTGTRFAGLSPDCLRNPVGR